ncbi:MAG: undecaprenyl/decaprenyl-phosphate alpha-N-acetylglucosaminyl 1-phosphate transferase [Chitinophagaceae bacterium]|nr:MAG: undecaprenyl/decaprenyl-phosphate alpha-N-acetylglucosaminyl 1-phosphate transferase [Chitinophagaceae bacterium]
MNTDILFAFAGLITAAIIAAYGIPSIIKVANIKKLYDKPGGRKTHKGFVPNLGGIPIFAAFFIAFLCWADFSGSSQWQYLLLGLIILHFIGVKDDISPLVPAKKLMGQVLAASILVIPGRFRINNLHGVLGIHQLPMAIAIPLSIFAVIVIINSFNLIDGIDGLAAGLSIIIAAAFAVTFWQKGMYNPLVAAMILTGALISFLFYNHQPARIFMGDTGSMGIGYLMAAFSFEFVNIANMPGKALFHHNPSVVIAFLIIPLFDTLRVFSLRIFNKKSPFTADRNHVHHRLQSLGLEHKNISLIFYSVNILFIGLAFLMKDLNPNVFILVIVGTSVFLASVPNFLLHQRAKWETGKIQPAPAIHITTIFANQAVESVPAKQPVANKMPLN